MGIGTRSLKRDSNWLQALPAADRHVAVAPRHRRGEGTPPYGNVLFLSKAKPLRRTACKIVGGGVYVAHGADFA